MNESDLRALIADHESDRVELTTATRDTKKFCEAICAFANDLPNHEQPGYLLIGVEDNRRIAGLVVSQDLMASIGNLRDSGVIQPLPTMTVEKVATSDGEVAVITVYPSPLPPVRYRGRVCVRFGSRKGYATEHEEQVLIERRVSHARTFDAQPCCGSAVTDLALPLFLNDYLREAVASEVIEENNRSVEQQLASLRFFDQKLGCPTNAGIILFGMDVRHYLSGAYIQFLRVSGTGLDGTVEADREIYGDLLTMLRELDALVPAQIDRYPVRDTALRERTVASYPIVAIRELLLNAVLHRSYESTSPIRFTWFDDRIEIQSPGGLYGEASPQNFPMQTSYRNPVVAEALKNLGYVNRFGRGVLRAQAALAENGSPEAQFSFDSGYVLVSIPRRT